MGTSPVAGLEIRRTAFDRDVGTHRAAQAVAPVLSLCSPVAAHPRACA
jgi:hypothetical protein